MLVIAEKAIRESEHRQRRHMEGYIKSIPAKNCPSSCLWLAQRAVSRESGKLHQ